MPVPRIEALEWSSPKKLDTQRGYFIHTKPKEKKDGTDSGGSSGSTPQSMSSRRFREERSSTPDNFKFVQLRKVQRKQEPIRKGNI
jgi:hypothetical protein